MFRFMCVQRLAMAAMCALVCVTLVSVATAGPDMYCTGDDGTTLVKIDVATGVSTTIGPSGYGTTYAAAFTPDGTLWTITNGFTGSPNLATFNLNTGLATNVGAPFVASDYVIALEADAAGNLFAAGFDGMLYHADKTTGQLSPIGNTGISSQMDLAFDSHGTLYGMANGTGATQLYTIDTGTAASQMVGLITGPLPGYPMGIAFDASDNAYLTDYVPTPWLWSLDMNTLQATQIGLGLSTYYPHGGDILVPEPATLSLLVLGGLAMLRRSRRE